MPSLYLVPCWCYWGMGHAAFAIFAALIVLLSIHCILLPCCCCCICCICCHVVAITAYAVFAAILLLPMLYLYLLYFSDAIAHLLPCYFPPCYCGCFWYICCLAAAIMLVFAAAVDARHPLARVPKVNISALLLTVVLLLWYATCAWARAASV